MKRPQSTILSVLLTLILCVGLFVAVPAFAQEVDMESFAQAAGFSTTASITVIIARLIRTAITLTGVVAVAFIVYGGFVWMTSGGDATRLKKAKGIITNAIIGLVLVFASFAIVSFVLSALVEATRGPTYNPPRDPYYPDPGGSSAFIVTFNDECAEVLQNFQPQLIFSKKIDLDAVEEGIYVKDSNDEIVEGTYATSGYTVTFTPSTHCDGYGDQDVYCFVAGARYTLYVDSSIVESITGASLTCNSINPCSFVFTVGSSIDTSPPTVDMNRPSEDGESFYNDLIEQLKASTLDDSGVSMVDFYVIDDDAAIYSSSVDYSNAGALTGGSIENGFYTDDSMQWDTTVGYTTNEEYEIWAKGYDCAGNTDTADRITIILRAANCHNGDYDDGDPYYETGLCTDGEPCDCGGDSSSVYYCGACEGDECTENKNCSTGQCVDGTCVSTPKIEGVSPGDGAVGNLVTISGEGFGTSGGTITFLGDETASVTASAYTCNTKVQWSDDEIIVQVPIDATDGPVSVTTSDAKTERTDDDYGPSIADFDVNLIERPGICMLDPDSDTYGRPVDVTGIGFGSEQGTSTFYFTNYEASSYPSWEDKDGEFIQVVVPNVNSGSYRTQVFTGDYVCVSSDGEATSTMCSDDDGCETDAGESCATAWCSETLDYCDDDDDCGDEGGSCESVRVGSNKVSFTVEDVSSGTSPVISYVDTGWKACSVAGSRCGDNDDCDVGETCDDADNWGPPGQYMTIYGTGFGTSIGSVYFENNNESSDYSALGDTIFPDVCGEDFWHDTYIIVKVPETYLDVDEYGERIAIKAVEHALSVKRVSDGAISNTTKFVVLDDTPGPAICDIVPSSAPAGYEDVTLYGENFGTSNGIVTFYSLQEASFGVWENDEISSVVVPDDAATGPVYATEAENSYTSNSITFAVGDCREEKDDFCGTGEMCCDNGTCDTLCETQTEVEAHYAFRITTGITPNTPNVVVSCTENGVSPAPWEGWSDPEDICVNASVEAEFDMTMDQDTLTTSTVVVRKCTAKFTDAEESKGDAVCSFSSDISCSTDSDCTSHDDEECLAPKEGECKNWEVVPPLKTDQPKTDNTGFSWLPEGDGFATNTLYRVTLQGEDQIQAADREDGEEGGYMEEDFEWEFTTSSSVEPCEVGEVNVRPYEYTQTEQTTVDYSAQLIAANDRCVALSCSGYQLSWDSNFDGAWFPDGTNPELGVCTNVVMAQEETPVDNPAVITATVTNADNKPFDDGYLTINFLDPEIENYFPQCSTACVNAQPWGEFNTRMDGGTIGTSSITLYECLNSLCETSGLTAFADVASVSFSGAECGADDDSSQIFYINFVEDLLGNTATMDPNTWYRVVIDGDAVMSCTGVALSESGSNYGTDENRYFENAFSWTFKTKDDAVSCAIDSVTLNPELATMTYISQRAEFYATAQGVPDDCSASGQTLQSDLYEWQAWTATDSPTHNVGATSGSESSQDEIVAYMILDGTIELTTDIPVYCTSACLNAGAPVTTAQGVCGNNEIEDSEECDDGGAEDGDGCSSSCLNEGSSETCGNGTLDEFEDCDGGDGCSSICLNEGSRSVSATCGDGEPRDWAANTGGEDCDDGNSASGDGCSSNCLLEGSASKEDVYAICGNGTSCSPVTPCDSDETCNDEGWCVEQGEDCDPGYYDAEGDGCSSACLYEGSPTCPDITSRKCCGNEKIEPEAGEECDGEEGCSSSCLWAGSSYAYSIPSFCGDNPVLGIGEECDTLSTEGFSTGDYGVSQIATGAPVEVDEETGYAISTVSVTVEDDIIGEATLQLQCACTTDDTCGETTRGCGVSNCCFVRPTIVNVYPSSNSGALEDGEEGYCRNTAVWIEFSTSMDEDTFDETLDDDGDGIIQQNEFTANLYLDLVSVDSDGDGYQEEITQIEDCPTGYDGADISTTTSAGERFWNWMKSLVLGLFGRDVSASEAFACHVPVTYELIQNDDETKLVYLRLSQLLEENAVYRLVAVGDSEPTDASVGLLSENGVSLCLGSDCTEPPFSQSFEIGDEICDLDRVLVEDTGNVDAAEYEDLSIAYFSSTGEIHEFVATPQTYRTGSGYEEISTSDSYAWSLEWTSSKTDDEEGDVVERVAGSSEGITQNYIASGYTGREHVLSTATITVDDLFDPTTAATEETSARTVTGSLEVTALVCENPWPAVDFPYNDSPSNFSFYYCRDAGDTGIDDDLPDLGEPIEVTSLSTSGILQELIFKVEGSNDAIGVRVIPNVSFCSVTTSASCGSDSDCPSGESCMGNGSYLTPSAWVEAQQFTGSFSETELDGYPAVEAGNTLYATAANVSGSTIYPNIYVVSYNENASEEAQEIFNQLLENWRFNGNTDEVTDVNLCQNETTLSYELYYEDEDDTSGEYVSCEWDGDCYEAFEDTSIVCDAQKGKLTRDMTRLLDVVDMATTIEEYGDANGHCSVTKGQSCDEDDDCPGTEECLVGFPEVQSGTFVPALSNSIWSSWSAALGNDLGTALPTDPINEFYNCSESGYDAASCWNGEEGTFICPDNSHLYGYQSVGGEAYKLYAVLESDGVDYTWAYALDTELSDEVTVYVEYPTQYAPDSISVLPGFSATPVFCDGSMWGDSELCGDGTQGAKEDCELGDTTTGVTCEVCVNPDDDTLDGEKCDDDADCGTGGTCASGTSSYACAIDAANKCSWDTSTSSACVAYECGNGVVETDEICDDGSLNGTYGHCDDECGAGSAIYCGDGYLAASEQCDCGTTSTYDTVIVEESSWAYLNSTAECVVSNGQYNSTGSCAYNCTEPGLSCGDGRVNGSEECDGDYEEWEGALCSDGTKCTTDADCDTGTCGAGGLACGVGDICTDFDDAGDSCTVDTQCDAYFATPSYESESCTSSGVCASSSNAGNKCESSTSCDSGLCGDFNYDLFRYRTCSSSCSWGEYGGWGECVGGTQICGNGTVEGNEACDDGNSTNNDACLNTCVKNVCGDGDVYVGVESCDDGSYDAASNTGNGAVCTAGYEDTCNYCNATCQYKTASGSYCGDRTVDTGEVCDGGYATNLIYFDGGSTTTYQSCDEEEYDDTVTDDQDTQETVDDVTYTCRWLGVCNGGSENGSLCTLDYKEYVDTGTVQDLTHGRDRNSCAGDSEEGDEGECIAPVCADDCGSSCPFRYESTGLLVQSEASGSSPSDSISLYSYFNSEGDSPDNGVLYVPACSVATSITADIDDTDVVSLPDINIVFVTDLSGSMNWDMGANTYCDGGTNAGNACEPDAEDSKIGDPIKYEKTEESDIGSKEKTWTDDETGESDCPSGSCTSNGAEVGIRRIDIVVEAIKETVEELFDSYGSSGTIKISLVSFSTLVDTSDGVVTDIRDAGESQEQELLSILDNYIITVDRDGGGGTPTYAGVESAVEILKAASSDEADVKIVVLLSDGNPTFNQNFYEPDSSDNCEEYPWGNYPTNVDDWYGVEACVAEIADNLIDGSTEGQPRSDIIFYSVAITTDNDLKGYMAHMSSNVCAWNHIDDTSDCEGNYAYDGENAKEIELVYQDITDSILGTKVTFTTIDSGGNTITTTGAVSAGSDVELPFPDGFVCESTEQTIPIRNVFEGDGSILFSDFNLTYCPYE